MTVNKQLDYYQKQKINPVDIETSGSKWLNHISCRHNFYERHLGIPTCWFNGKKILEFGPNGGENSLILAKAGALISLVEPHQLMHARINTLFTDNSLIDHLIKIDAQSVENYEDKSQYDMVIAEGFLNVLPDRSDAIRKLCTFSSNFVVFSIIEKHGYFFESLKRCLMRRLIEINCLNDSDWDKVIHLAQRLFLNSYNKLGSARTFDSWVKDSPLNPCVTSQSLDSFDQLISVLDEINFKYYSSSPNWDLRNTHKWYKNVSNTSLKNEYNKNIPFFITGNINDQITSECIKSISSMTEIFSDYNSGLKEVGSIKKLNRLSQSSWRYANEVNDLLGLIVGTNTKEITNYYLRSNLKDLWGMPNHYICLKRNVHE